MVTPYAKAPMICWRFGIDKPCGVDAHAALGIKLPAPTFSETLPKASTRDLAAQFVLQTIRGLPHAAATAFSAALTSAAIMAFKLP
jgi:hypothetical protein